MFFTTDKKLLIKNLNLLNFRNLKKLIFSPSQGFNVIYGPNGAGKTNLMESIYMLGALRSFRTVHRRDMINHDSNSLSIEAQFKNMAGLISQIEISKDKKLVKLNGKRITNTEKHFQKFPMVMFHTSNMELLQGGPAARRRFLDRALFQAEPSYPERYADYMKALRNRNHLLRDKNSDKRVIDVYSKALVESGLKLVESRSKILNEIKPLFIQSFMSVSSGLSGKIKYKPSLSGDIDKMMYSLDKKMDMDFKRGFTSVGPHADDFEVFLEDKSARKFASQGQQRAMVLSLKIAETQVLTKATGKVPIMILDDVSSELDRHRNRRLFEFLSYSGGQIFITTTHLSHILVDKNRKDIKLEDGKIVK